MSASDPRDLGGSISGPGGPYGENDVVLDTERAVILHGVDVALVGGVREGVVHPDPIIALVMNGRINKTDEQVQVLYLLNEDGAAGIVSELIGVAHRAGWGPEFVERFEKRMKEMPL